MDEHLKQAVEWVLNDAHYKAPEQIGIVAQRWIDKLEQALAASSQAGAQREGGQAKVREAFREWWDKTIGANLDSTAFQRIQQAFYAGAALASPPSGEPGLELQELVDDWKAQIDLRQGAIAKKDMYQSGVAHGLKMAVSDLTSALATPAPSEGNESARQDCGPSQPETEGEAVGNRGPLAPPPCNDTEIILALRDGQIFLQKQVATAEQRGYERGLEAAIAAIKREARDRLNLRKSNIRSLAERGKGEAKQ